MASIPYFVNYQSRKITLKLNSPNETFQNILLEAANKFQLNPQNCLLKYKKDTIDCSQPSRFLNIPKNSVLELISANNSNETTIETKPTKVIVTRSDAKTIHQGIFPSSHSLGNIIEHFIASNDFPALFREIDVEVVYLSSAFFGWEKINQITLNSLGVAGLSVKVMLKVPQMKTNELQTIVKETEETQAKEPSSSEPFLSSSSANCLIEPNESKMDVVSAEESVSLSIREILETFLHSNFDVVSKPALLTITKYLLNISANPNDKKYHKINATNKVFLEKVFVAKNHDLLLRTIGFLPETTAASPLFWLFSSSDLSQIQANLDALYHYMNILEIPSEEQPRLTQTQPLTAPSPAPFDPFKSTTMRTAVQPVRERSKIEEELNELNERKTLLMGKPDDVSRDSRVVFPQFKAIFVDNEPSSLDLDNDFESSDNNTTISKSKLQAILNPEKPFTTKSMRDLQKMKKIKFYNKTLIRIRFPDRVELIGYFHPNHTIDDVYSWILEELQPSFLSNLKETNEIILNNYFDLFITPPKTILSPSPPSLKRKVAAEEVQSLEQLGFIPTAIVNLSWKQPWAEEFLQKSQGCYLSDHWIAKSDGKSSQPIQQTFNIPQGILISTSTPSTNNSTETSEETNNKLSSQSDAKSKSTSGKPKWLKV